MVRWRLVSELHGSDGYTSLGRLVAAFGLVVATGLVAQLLGSSWYMGRMLPGTTIGDQAVGGLTLPQAGKVLQAKVVAAKVDLVISGQQFAFTPSSMGLEYNVSSTLRTAYDGQHVRWSLAKPKLQQSLIYRVDSAKMAAAVEMVAGKIGVQPVDANVVVASGQLQTVADKAGYTVDRVGLLRLIERRAATTTTVKLAASPRRQTADISTNELGPTLAAAQAIMAVPLTLSYHDRSWTPSAATIGSWLGFVRSTADTGEAILVPQVQSAKVKGYLQTIANQVDVSAVNQLVTIQNGATTVNQVGSDGTATDQDPAVSAIMAALAARQPLSFTITDHVVAFKTIATNFTVLDYPKYIEVNLSKQHLWVWQDGQIIYDAPITSGATGAGFPTVTGLFSIYYKTTNTHLRGYQYGPQYNYDVQVDYWMPFYSGYGLHDASWRNGKFGGSDYYYGGSHGCVNLPDAAAEFIYNWSSIGTPVWVHK